MAFDPKKSSRRTLTPAWWFASLVFHALLLGWLIFFSPIHFIDLTAKRANPAPSASPARVAQVMDQVRQQQSEMLAGEVRALEAAHRELAALEAGKRDELRKTSTNAPTSIDKISAAQDNIAKAQTTAATTLKKAISERTTNTSDLSTLTNMAAAIETAQTGAGQFQAQALEALALADPKFEPAYQAQAEANAAQSRAAQAQAEAEGQLTGAAALLAKNAPKADDLAEAKETLRAAESQLAAALGSSVTLSNSLPRLRAEAVAAKTAFDAAQTGGDKAQISAAKKRASETRRVADGAQKSFTRAQSDIPKFQSRVTEQAARIAKFSGKQSPVGMNPAAMQQGAAEKLREAQSLQATATATQARAAKSFTDARDGVVSPVATTAQHNKDLAGVYQSAVQTESELAESYRRLRATELAMQRQIPLAQALELTDVARPARPDLAAALSNSPSNGADLAAQRQAILEARSQIAAMRSLADSMLAQARGSGTGAGAAQQQNLAQLATEDDNQRAKDLTGAMQGRAGTGSGKGDASSGSTASGSGSGGTGGSGGGASSGLNPGGSGEGTSSGPPPMPKDLAAVSGRVIGTGAVSGRWMFVDSWYLIGPFDNAGRANIEKQFPPETVVDLNATYVGKRGQPVRWEFHQSPQPRVVPPFDDFNPLPSGAADGGGGEFKARDLEYIIYYAYTELRAEAECDVWIAVGSDDFSKLWIDDQLVWASGQQQKSWRVDEGFRKVHLKQGVNRVLFRVENGRAQTEFSLVVCAQ